jgi:SAM-dependent methyltransferase
MMRPCPICENEKAEILHSQRFVLPEGHPLNSGYDIVCCNICGFVYADTAVTQAAYDHFYAQYSKYEDRKTGTGGVDNEWDHKRVAETALQVAEFINNPNARILDVGCANGGLLKAMKDLGYNHTLGIDPAPACVENTRLLGVDAEVGSLFQPLRQEPFECVVLSHVLEHVQDLKKAMEWIHTVLNSNGYIYIEVPDALRYTDFVDAPFQDFNTEHINHFSITSLQNLLQTNDFEPLEWGGKVIPASANKPYPAIYCFAKPNDPPKQDPQIKKDNDLKEKIISYNKLSRQILDQIESRLSISLSESKHVVVWGTGQLAMKLLVETSLAQADILAFVDSNPINQGRILRGIKVIAPEEVSYFTEPILITSTLHQQSITEQITKMGLQNKLILLKD